jgi:hypothetical protein
MGDLTILKAKLKQLLPTLNLDTATPLTVRKQLERELGIPLDEHKDSIKV